MLIYYVLGRICNYKRINKKAKMNKKQLVAKIASACNMGKSDAEKTFDKITNIILDTLKADETVKIAGFGTYKVAKRKARRPKSKNW